jgi:hypothetical protein
LVLRGSRSGLLRQSGKRQHTGQKQRYKHTILHSTSSRWGSLGLHSSKNAKNIGVLKSPDACSVYNRWNAKPR